MAFCEAVMMSFSPSFKVNNVMNSYWHVKSCAHGPGLPGSFCCFWQWNVILYITPWCWWSYDKWQFLSEWETLSLFIHLSTFSIKCTQMQRVWKWLLETITSRVKSLYSLSLTRSLLYTYCCGICTYIELSAAFDVCLGFSVWFRLGALVAASVYEQKILFLYRHPPALRQVLATSVHLLLTPEMMSMFVNVNRHVGNNVHTGLTVICKV